MLYPLNLELAGRSCAIIGGGQVACRKAKGLLAAGAQVTVIAPELTGSLQELARQGRISWRSEGYQRGMLQAIRP